MKYPIEQSDIDKAIKKLKVKPKKKFKRRYPQYITEIKELDRRLDYAIWKDKP